MTSPSINNALPFSLVPLNDPKALASEIRALQISNPEFLLSPLENVVDLPSNPYSLLQGDSGNLFLVSTTGSAVTITLPVSTGVEVGSKFTFVRKDVFNNITVQAQGSDIIRGLAGVAGSGPTLINKSSIVSVAASTGAQASLVVVQPGVFQLMGIASQFA